MSRSELPENIRSALEQVVVVAREHAVRVDETGCFPQETVDALRAHGLFGLVSPKASGGVGGTIADAAFVVEALARVCGSSAMVACMHYCGAQVIAQHGRSEDNVDVVNGALSTLAFSEAGSRSHFWAPTSTAAAEADHVKLDANKSWVTSARHADLIVWSSTPVTAEGASTLWLVPKLKDGAVIGDFRGLGLRGNDSAPVRVEGLLVDPACRLGEDGGGFDIMMGCVLPIFSACNAAGSIGLMSAALEGACTHVSATRHDHLDSALRDLPTIRAYLAKATVDKDMARALWLDTLMALEGGREDAQLRVLEVKAACGEAALEVVSTCMRVCGGAAYRRELGVDRAFRDAQAASVMAPTSDVLFDFIGKAITGMELF